MFRTIVPFTRYAWLASSLLGLVLVAVIPAGPPPAGPTHPHISPLDVDQIGSLAAANPATLADLGTLAIQGNSAYLPLQIEFKDIPSRKQFRAPQGVTVYSEFDRFADAFLDLSRRQAIDDILAMQGTVWVDVDLSPIHPPPAPQPVVSAERPRSVHPVVRGGFGGLTGKGVVVAIVDDGVDFHHRDFITTDAEGHPRSRITAYWDPFAIPAAGRPGSPAPFVYPNGAPIGVVYNNDELTAEIRNPTGKILGYGNHGTCCAGIAAGNGRSRTDSRFAGVAPDAELLVVRIGTPGPWSQHLLGAACAWLDEKAGDKPMVVSCSFGHPAQGGRDGCRVLERQLDARFPSHRKGRTLCVAAGNEGSAAGPHAETTFKGPEDKGVLSWNVWSNNSPRITIFVQTDRPDDVELAVKSDPAPQIYRYVHPLSGDLVIELGWKANAAPTGTNANAGQFELWTRSRTPLRADAFLDTNPWLQGSFRNPSPTPLSRLRTPGSMHNAITVASYDFNNIDDRGLIPLTVNDHAGMPMKLGFLSSYSSAGYNRRGAIKPDFAAPGQWHIAPQPGGGAPYRLFNGTSAATPYTAGIVALLLQKRPDLTVGEIKALLRTHVTTDDITGKTPNPRWGHGRLDFLAVQATFEALR